MSLLKTVVPILFACIMSFVSVADAVLPTNNDPSNQIRFATPAQADAARQRLIQYVWPNGLDTSSVPVVTRNVPFPAVELALPGADPEACTIDRSLVSSVDRLDANVSGWDFHSVSYLLRPTNTANADRLVIVMAGHDYGLMTNGTGTSNGLDRAVNGALRAGFSVVAMQMPLYGWHPNTTDKTAVLPGAAGTVMFNTHDEIFEKVAPHVGGGATFRLFLEPVVQNINHFKKDVAGAKDVSMIGLSGGAWTAHMAAAIDTRIKLSVPVAGSAPLYVRNSDPGSFGDDEQNYPELYNEDIKPDGSGGGVATWLEIYALGGYGDGRRQIMVTNLYDKYFAGTFPDTFKDIVSTHVGSSLGKGQWEHVLDATHGSPTQPEHLISPHVVDDVFLPAALQVPEPAAGGAVLFYVGGVLAFRRRRNRRAREHSRGIR